MVADSCEVVLTSLDLCTVWAWGYLVWDPSSPLLLYAAPRAHFLPAGQQKADRAVLSPGFHPQGPRGAVSLTP